MQNRIYMLVWASLLVLNIQCKKEESLVKAIHPSQSTITDATGFTLNEYEHYTVLRVLTPWPNAKKPLTYILAKQQAKIADSLTKYPIIQVPLKEVVVTSTTNVPFLEILGVENTLSGFPHTDYISSPKTRKRIDTGQLINVGENEKLDLEKVIELAPSALVSFEVTGNNTSLVQIEKAGIPVLIQADWMEQTPLGKAEWIKFFGVLFCKEKQANAYFNQVKASYHKALKLVQNTVQQPTVMYGSMYQDQWYMAKGDSWIARFIKDAKGNYLWKNLKGVGSEPLTFEQVLDKGQNATIWITTGTETNWSKFGKLNPHYTQFKAYKNKKIYTFEGKKGPKGGTVFFELSPAQPDKVLNDYIKIFHPNLLPHYSFTFATPLQ